MNCSENMVGSRHQLFFFFFFFLRSQTDRCWPFGATKTGKQTRDPSCNPFVTAPVLIKWHPNRLPSTVRVGKHLYSWPALGSAELSSAQLLRRAAEPRGQSGERLKVEGGDINASVCLRVPPGGRKPLTSAGSLLTRRSAGVTTC